MKYSADDVKVGAVYRSKATDRLWRWDGETMWTKGRLDVIWHEAGWPHPSMRRIDIAYYLFNGDFEELRDEDY